MVQRFLSGLRLHSCDSELAFLGMGQRIARQRVEQGVQYYHDHRHEEAIARWRSALRRLRAPNERFITLGYLAQAHGEIGRYRDMLVYALNQIDLANEQDDTYMRAEAYLNLARANERLSEYHKAISYARHCLQNQSEDPRTPGYAYLVMGLSYLGFTNFQRALESFELAMQVANRAQDKLLELQICVGLGSLFSQIKDYSKAWLFLDSGRKLLDTIKIPDVYAKYQSLVQYHISYVLLKKNDIDTATSLCEEALQIATANANKPIRSRCLLRIGDIHQATEAPDKCWEFYESGYQLMLEMNDRYGQMMGLASMARCATMLKTTRMSQCECQALELNRKCLEVAKMIGCKLGQLKCHVRLQSLYASLSDSDGEQAHKQALDNIVKELEMFCDFCGLRFGVSDESLQALPCSHIFHERCLQRHVSASTSGGSGVHCPKCLPANPGPSSMPSPFPTRMIDV